MSKRLTSPFVRAAMGFLAGAGLILLAQAPRLRTSNPRRDPTVS